MITSKSFFDRLSFKVLLEEIKVYIGDRPASMPHTRLRLNFSALNYHLFQKNCCPSPACALCDAPVEDAKHYRNFLYWPSFAALGEKLFASAAPFLTRECAHAHERVIAIVVFSLGRSVGWLVGWLVGSVVNFRACAVNEF